jgi:hypothetical protein
MLRIRRKHVLTAVLVVVSFSVLAGGGYWVWLTTPPELPDSLEQATGVIGSARFERMSQDRKQAYADRVRELMHNATDEQRRAFRDQMRDNDSLRDLREQQMLEMARKFALASAEEQERMLDEAMAMMRSFGPRGGGPPGPPGDRPRGDGPPGGADQQPPSPDEQQRREERRNEMVNRMQERAATGNPQDGALIHDFFRRLRERRERTGPQPR